MTLGWVICRVVYQLIAAEAQYTVYTEAFSPGWGVPQRVLRSAVNTAHAFQGEFVDSKVDTWNDRTCQMRRLECGASHQSATGNIEAFPHLAGGSVGGVRKEQTVAKIIIELTNEPKALLQRWH